MKDYSLDEARPLLARALGVDGLLKLMPAELAGIPCGEFFHVNAAPCSHLAGQRFGAVGMTQSESTGSAETRVTVEDAVAVECLETMLYPGLMAVPEDVRRQMLGADGNDASLQEVMLRRYGALRGWSKSDMLCRPVVVSRMRRCEPTPSLECGLAATRVSRKVKI